MYKTQHTPGPWNISQVVTQSTGLRVFHLDSDTGGPIGYFDSLDDPDGDDEANAVLIAAAPDLLDACSQILSLNPDDYSNQEGYVRIVRRLATTAIKKAQQKGTGQ